MILFVAGHVASGKSTYATSIAKELGWRHVSFKDYVGVCASKLNLDSNDRETLQDVGHVLAKRPQLFARGFWQWVHGEDDLVIDGLRHSSVFNEISSLCPGSEVVILFVDTPIEIVSQRFASRGRDYQTLEQVRSHVVEQEINAVRSIARWIVDGSDEIQLNSIIADIRNV